MIALIYTDLAGSLIVYLIEQKKEEVKEFIL